METFIRYVLQNVSLSSLILGLMVSGVVLWRRARPLTPSVVVEDLFSYFLLFAVGVAFLYNFAIHTFLGTMAANFIGWAPSPFQKEVGAASLGFSLVGFLAFRGSFGLRTAAVVAPATFSLGAAAGHAYQMVVAHNFAPGNAGVVFYMDIAIPLIGATLLWLQHRCDRESSIPRSVSGEGITPKEMDRRQA